MTEDAWNESDRKRIAKQHAKQLEVWRLEREEHSKQALHPEQVPVFKREQVVKFWWR